METGEQAHTERAIQHPTFPFTQPAHRVLYPVGSLQYLFIMRVNVSELHGQFNNCICFAAVMWEYRDSDMLKWLLFVFGFYNV